jgi:hypothetical protein
MMTLTEFEQHVNEQLSDGLITAVAIEDEHEFDASVLDLLNRLEHVALSEQVEVCERMSYLLVLALYDGFLNRHSEQLNVPPELFQGSRPIEDEAHAYLAERRYGAPARHAELAVN